MWGQMEGGQEMSFNSKNLCLDINCKANMPKMIPHVHSSSGKCGLYGRIRTRLIKPSNVNP